MEEFKVRLREALNARGMRPAELSRRSGISEATLSQYLHGYCEPKSKKIGILADALQVDEGWLIGFDTPMERYDPSHQRPKPDINEYDVKQFVFGTTAVSEETWKEFLLMVAFLKNKEENNNK